MKILKQITIFVVVLVMMVSLLPIMTFATNERSAADKVGDNVMHPYYSAKAASYFEDPTLGMWPMKVAMKSGTYSIDMGSAWDRDYFYLAYEKQDGTPTINLNGKTVSGIQVKSTDTLTLVKVPFTEAGIVMSEFGYSCSLKVTAGWYTWEGKVFFESKELSTIPAPSGSTANTDNYGMVFIENGYHFFSTKSKGSDSRGWWWNMSTLAASNDEACNVIEFDFTPVSMPEVSTIKATLPRYMAQGFQIFMSDDTAVSGNDKYMHGLFVNIMNYKGELCIMSGDDTKNLIKTGFSGTTTETLHVRIEYDNANAFAELQNDKLVFNNPTARYYINGTLVGIDTSAKAAKGPTNGKNALVLSCKPVSGKAMEFYVTNFRMGYDVQAPMDATAIGSMSVNSITTVNPTDGTAPYAVLPSIMPGGQMNGVELEWTSGNPDVMDNTGKVLNPSYEGDITMIATMKGTTASKSFKLMLKSGVLCVVGIDDVIHTLFNAKAAGYFDTPALGLWALDAWLKNGNDFIDFGAAWDRDYIYLAYDKQDATPAIILNGLSCDKYEIKTTDAYTLVKIALADVGILMGDFGEVCALNITVGNYTWNGTIYMDSKELDTLPSTPSVNSGALNGYGVEIKDGNNYRWYATDTTYDSTSSNKANRNIAQLTWWSTAQAAAGKTANVVEFDFIPTDMPAASAIVSSGDNLALSQGFQLYLSDSAAISGNEDYKHGFNMGIVNLQGEFVIVSNAVAKNVYPTGIPGSSTEPFHVRIEYDNMDAWAKYDSETKTLSYNACTVRYYVNGTLVGTDLDGKAPKKGPTNGKNSIDMRGIPIPGKTMEFTVANFRLGYIDQLTLDNTVLDGIKFDDIKGNNLSASGVGSDLVLPNYAPGGKLNGLEITWKSMQPDVITDDGKVLNANYDGLVELVATVNATGAQRSIYLKMANSKLTVPGATGITIDGNLNDGAWTFVDKLVGDSNPKRFGAVWSGDSLYIACEKVDLSTVKVYINGNLITDFEGKSGDLYTEIKVPMASAGISGAAGTVCSVSIQAGDLAWYGTFTLGSAVGSFGVKEILLIVLIVLCAAFIGLLVWAFFKRELLKKLWFIIVLCVLLLAGIGSGIAMALVKIPFDDGRSSQAKLQMPTSTLGSMIPNLNYPYGSVTADTADSVMIEVLDVTRDDFEQYVKLAKKSGYTDAIADQSNCYMANNIDNYIFSVNYAENEAKMYVSIAVPSFLTKLNYDNLLMTNLTNGAITSDLRLPTSATTGENAMSVELTWYTSDPTTISTTGKVARPDDGVKEVILTAEIKATGEKKHFSFRVPGYNFGKGTLFVKNDYNPAAGAGLPYSDAVLNFDASSNSIIYDFGSVQKVNYVTLTEFDNDTRVVSSNITLWVSNDNVTYTRVEGVKLLHDGRRLHLYGFNTEAQYVKAHFGIWEDAKYTFSGLFGEMITAGYEEFFGAKGATYNTVEYTLSNNTGKNQTDYAWTIDINALGITCADSSIRVKLGDEFLYHYVKDGKIVVRVPEIAQGASVTLTIAYSESANTLDISNKEYVYEVVYGTKEIWTKAQTGLALPSYTYTLKKGTVFANGDVQEYDAVVAIRAGAFEESTDGGYTWRTVASVRNNPDPGCEAVSGDISIANGYMFDPNTGRLYATYYKYDVTPGAAGNGKGWAFHSHHVYSDNGGKTWNKGVDLPFYDYYKGYGMSGQNYNNGLVLSTFDGDGPNVDYVWSYGVSADPEIHTPGARVIYSKDAGKTWTWSDDVMIYGDGGFENGPSEGTIMERDDGVLVHIFRLQTGGVFHFGISWSGDHGVNWTQCEESDISAVNTQPIFNTWEVNGEDSLILGWPGFSAVGATSYTRTPLVFATTTNGDTYRNIQNIFLQTPFVNYVGHQYYCTNISFSKFGTAMFVTFNNPLDNNVSGLYINDFDNWLTKTKGAFDSFEYGNPENEGWYITSGSVSASASYATDGYYSMLLTRLYKVTRSIPYLQKGQVSMNIYAPKELSFCIDLQTTYTTEEYTDYAPVGLEVKKNEVYFMGSDEATGLKLQEGWNTLTFDLDLGNGKASFSVNGSEFKAMPVDLEDGDYITAVMIYGRSEMYVDEFMVIDEDEVVLNGTEADMAAADAVIAQIKAMGTDATAISNARKAFDALTQVQKDYVNCNVFEGTTKINYYDVLVAAEKG